MKLDGFTVAAEYGSRFEADLVAGRLIGDGIQATVLSDPAHQIAPHVVTLSGHQVMVSDADAHQAAERLRSHEEVAPAQLALAVGLGRRPRWFKWMALLLAGGTLIPLSYGVIIAIMGAF